MDIDEMLADLGLDDEVRKLVHEQDSVFNPGRGKTALEAHIQQQEELVRELYDEVVDEECDDPFEVLARKEEREISQYGWNLNSL